MKKARHAPREKTELSLAADLQEPLAVENWREMLAHFARATGLTLALFDPEGKARIGPLTASPLGETLISAGGWREPGGFCFVAAQEIAKRCIDGSALVSTTMYDVLSAVAVPIRDGTSTVGAIAAGWVFTTFPEPVSTDRLARALGLGFPDTWQIVRQVSPMSADKLALYADLLQMVADFSMKHRSEVAEKFRLIDDLKRQQTELERAARTRDELLAVVSHELRTPLTPILGWIPIMREELESGRIEQVREGLDTIERNANQEVHLVEDMLDVSRILTGRIVFSPEHVVPAQVIADAANAAHSLVRDRGLGIHTDLMENLPPVWTDKERLLQVLANLVSNAIKFTPDGGLITLGARQLGDVVEFFVRDTGIGVKLEAAALIFERFQQADSGISRRYGGLGIGLSVVKNLTEMQGGKVRVESSADSSGATFVISFPASAAPAPSVASAQQAKGPCRSSPPAASGRRAVGSKCSSWTTRSIRSTSCAGCSRAPDTRWRSRPTRTRRSTARQQPPDIIVSDIGMPECDGFQLLRLLQAELAPRKIPAIAVSGFSGENDRLAARESGFDAYFTKPLDVTALIDAVDRLLAAGAPRESAAPHRPAAELTLTK